MAITMNGAHGVLLWSALLLASGCAETLGIPLSTAYSRLYAARDKVRASLRRQERFGRRNLELST